MLKLSDIRSKLTFKITETSLVMHASEFLDKKYFKIDYNVYLKSKGKNLQRDFCWNDDQKSEFIISILKGIRISNLTIIHKRFVHVDRTRDDVFEVIDGKQRLSTLISFIQNEFPIKFKGSEYYFSDLDSDAKYEVDHGVPLVNIAYEWIYDDGKDNVIISDDEKIAWFEMINFAGTPQDMQHLIDLKK